MENLKCKTLIEELRKKWDGFVVAVAFERKKLWRKGCESKKLDSLLNATIFLGYNEYSLTWGKYLT